MKFEHDPKKSAINKLKHGITQEDVQELWRVPAVEMPAKSVNEPRYMIVGKIQGKFYSCVYTMRGENIRLISARRSREFEEKIYYDYVKEKQNQSHPIRC